jgi:hypothetical protein
MKPRDRNILIATSAAVGGVGIAIALALLVIVPVLRNTCTIFTRRCQTVSYQRQPNGQILVKDPGTGLSYWFDGHYIRSYGPHLPGACPSEIPRTIADADVGAGPERVLCERVRPDGTCASESGAPTIPSQLAGEPSDVQQGISILEPAFVMNAATLQTSRDGVLCSRARGVVENAFTGTEMQHIKVRVPPGSAGLSAAQMFSALKSRGVFTPPKHDPEPPVCNGHGAVDPVTARCVCEPGFVGERCGTKLCTHDGACGHGVCNAGLCVCDPGFSGDACTQRVCPVCVNGSCDPATGRCVCLPGFVGDRCEVRTCVQTCVNGSCNPVSGMCECEEGWMGAACENRRCVSDCSGNGVCNAPHGTCECVEGWRGEGCEHPVCPNDCSRNGVCNLDTEACECDPGWMGAACDTHTCPRGCCSHGSCDGSSCVCEPGWGGTDCSVPDDPLSIAITCPGMS